jgi:nicotinamidase-related amidase
MKDVLLLVDVLGRFEHEDGDQLLRSFRDRHRALVASIDSARFSNVPVIYAQDNDGIWDGDGLGLVRRALAGNGGGLVAAIAPRDGDRLIVKPRYSAFDWTPLELILRELETERILLAGTATEMCVAQTAISARELGFSVSVLAEACATVDEEHEALALDYLERIAGAYVERLSAGSLARPLGAG